MRSGLIRIPLAVVASAMSVLVGCSGALPPSSTPFQTVASPSAAADDLLRDLLALLPREGTYFERLAACLRASGWEAEVSDDGESLSYSFANESNRDEFQRDQRACDVVVPPPPVVPLTDAEVRAAYAHWVEMRRCLATLGYMTSEPPTEDEFVRSWATGPWSPYLDLPARALERVEDRCPQSPPGMDP